MRRTFLCSLLLSLLLFIHFANAFDPSLNWKTLTSSHFHIHYIEEHQALAEKTASLAETIHLKLSRQLNWTPKQRTHLVLTDHTDLANGYASPFPYNRSVLFIHPPAAGQLDFDSWLESLIIHEYTHVLHLDKAEGIPSSMRNVLGRFPILFPNSFQPSWLIEGYATYLETETDKAIGRGQSTLFKVMMREELKGGFKSLAEVNMASSSWPLNARYLYGYFFYEFLQTTYGKHAVDDFIGNYSDNWFPYLLNSNSEATFGKNLNQLWSEFEEYLRAQLLTNGNRSETSPAKYITNTGFYKYDLEQDVQGNVYVVQNDGVHQAALTKIYPDGRIENLVEINSLATIDLAGNGDVLIAQPEVCNEFYTFFDLYVFSQVTGELTRLTECSRYIEAQWDEVSNSIIALKANVGKFRLDRLSLSGEYMETLWQGDESAVVSHLELSPNAEWIAASVQRKGSSRANIELFNLSNFSWEKILPSQSHQWHPRFSQNGHSVSFSGESNHAFNLYLFDSKTRQLTRLTALNSAIFQHIVNDDRSKATGLVYTHRGIDIAEINIDSSNIEGRVAALNKEDTQIISLAGDGNTDHSFNFSISEYSPWPTILPKWWFPFAVGNDNTLEVGIQTGGMDALENHSYLAAASLEVERQLPNLFLFYQYHHSFDFQLQFYHDIADDNDATTSDLVIQNTDFEIGYHIPKRSVLDAWDLELALSFETERYYLWYQEDLNFVREFRDAYGGLALTYDSAKYFARSISANDGRSVRAVLATSDILESDFSGNTALLDWREYFQIYEEHSLALRMIAGSGDNQAQPFRIGGDFSDLFFFRAPTLLERRYALRGYPDYSDELTGRHLRYLSTEWRFPVAHIERTWMAPPLGIEKISGRIFYDQARIFGHTAPSILSRSEELADRIFKSSGAELMVQLRLFYYLPFDVRLGYANGHDDELGEDQVYLQFGTSF